MELKIVKRPLQDEYTKPEDIQYPGEKWCVVTGLYRKYDGGLSLWFKEIERVKPDIIYLYEITSFNSKIIDGENEIDDIITSVRYQFKKL